LGQSAGNGFNFWKFRHDFSLQGSAINVRGEELICRAASDKEVQIEKGFEAEVLLIFQGHDGLAIAAECSHFLQIAIGLWQSHHGSVAVHGVAGGGEVPTSAFGGMLDLSGWPAHGRRWLRGRQTQHQG
jgi:hypothetical protein